MKVYFEVYGCTLNKADTSLMKSLIIKAGHEISYNIEQADVIVINTCTVRKDTEERMLRRIRYLHDYALKNGKKLIVAGCMVSAQPYTVLKTAPLASLLSPQNITRIVEVIESNNKLMLIRGERDTNYLSIHMEGVIAAIPIAEGCLGDCSFCIVKIARRRLMSYKPQLIIRVVRDAIARGAKEIELTAQDTASYGKDLGHVRLHDLINAIIDEVKGNYYIRIGMSNPDTLSEILDGVLEVLRNPKVYKYLHIPLQSADDKVLKIMKRRYTYDDFKALIKELRSKIPEISIATDIIVGHPGEDNDAFERTVKAVKELMFDKVHLAQYTIRPRTEAASMPQIPEPEKKRRSIILSKVIEEVGNTINREYLGKYVKVLLTHRSFRGDVIGRTVNYKPVVLRDSTLSLGSEVYVRITDYTFFDLRGEYLE